MKLYFKILLIISIACNIYLLWDKKKTDDQEHFAEAFEKANGGHMSAANWKDGFGTLKKRVKSRKKYIFASTWANFCLPCLKEMPMLDSLAGMFNNIDLVFVTDVNDSIATNCLKKRKIVLKNSRSLNDMNDFISSVCNEAKIITKSYPMHIIMDTTGNVVYFSAGAFGNIAAARPLIDALNKFN